MVARGIGGRVSTLVGSESGTDPNIWPWTMMMYKVSLSCMHLIFSFMYRSLNTIRLRF